MFRVKRLRCIEWSLKTQPYTSAFVSETFSVQDRQCHLELYVGLSNNYGRNGYTTLYFKSKGKLLSPITITVRFVINCPLTSITADPIVGANETKAIIEYGGLLSSHELTIQVIIHDDSFEADKIIQTGSYLNGNVSQESLPDDFSKLLDYGLNQDAEIKCGEHSMKTHKAVLCARSKVFKAMLQSDMLEGQTGVLQIEDMDGCFFRDFMHYLYTGSMPELNFDKAKALYEVGDKYGVRSLMLRCSEYLQDILSRDNFFECFLLADIHSDQELKDKVKSFVLDEKVFLEEEYWPSFYEKFPKIAWEIYRLSYKKIRKE